MTEDKPKYAGLLVFYHQLWSVSNFTQASDAFVAVAQVEMRRVRALIPDEEFESFGAAASKPKRKRKQKQERPE